MQRHNAHPASLPAALLALLVLAMLLVLGLRPPAARPAVAPVDEFSAARALDILQHLLAEGVAHPVGTPENAVVRDRIVAHLEAIGYDVDVQRAFACRAQGGMCAPVENILTRLPGSGGSGRAVVLASHYDSRGAGPGAADAGAAVAAILEVARIIRAEAPFLHDVILLVTDGEEVGLLGAEAFVAEHPWAADVALVINLEARGTTGPSIMFETSDDNRWLVSHLSHALRRPVANSLTYDVYRMLPNDTDATVFRREGMHAINFAFIGGLARYHTARDDIAHLDLRTLQHHGDNALAAVRRFADVRLQPQAGNATYFDVFGIALLHWPQAWTLPLAVLALLFLAASAALSMRRRELRSVEMLWALLAALVGVAAAVAIGVTAGALLSLTGRPGAFHAHPQPALFGLWCGAAAAALLPGWLLARRAGYGALFHAPWLVIALLALLTATRLPGAAVVLLVPAMIGALAAGAAHLVRTQAGRDAAVIAAACGAGFSLVPLAILLYSAFVLEMPAAISAVVGLAALPLLPLLDSEPHLRRERGWTLAGALAIATGAFALAVIVPGYSQDQPRPMNVLYVQDAAADRAWWAIQGVDVDAASLPPDMRDAASFSDSVPYAMPALGRGPTAPAPVLPLPKPAVAAVREDDGALALAIEPSRRGNRVILVASGAGRHLDVEGRTLRGLRGPSPGSTMWIIHGVPAAGVRLRLPPGPAEDVALSVYEFTPGLPPAAAPLLQGRPGTAAPAGDGDVTVTVTRVVVAI